MVEEVDFMHAVKNKSFLQDDSINSGVCSQVDFLHADNHESLLQIDTMILMGLAKYF